MSIFKLLLSIGKESTSIASRGIKDTSLYLHNATEKKLAHVNEQIIEYKTKQQKPKRRRRSKWPLPLRGLFFLTTLILCLSPVPLVILPFI